MRTDHVLSFSVDPSLAGYRGARAHQMLRALQIQLSTLPGVENVSGAEYAVLTNNTSRSTTRVEGYAANERQDMNPVVNHSLLAYSPHLASR